MKNNNDCIIEKEDYVICEKNGNKIKKNREVGQC